VASPDPRQLILRIAGLAGAALFAFFFALTYHTPEWVEDFAADYIEGEVADQVDATIDSIGAPQGEDAISRYAAQLLKQNEARIAELRESFKEEARLQLAVCIAEIRGLTAEQRARLQAWLEDGAKLRIGSLQLENTRLVAIIQSGYLGVVADLKRDIRIFSASNACAFLLLLLVSFLKPEHTRALFVPGVLLTVSTAACAYLYVFEQNWLLTLIQGSYLGFAYAAWLGVAFLFLCDIWLNRARVTVRILDSMAHALGSAIAPS
jgi:uncharacterized protein YggL (DUF469 family)